VSKQQTNGKLLFVQSFEHIRLKIVGNDKIQRLKKFSKINIAIGRKLKSTFLEYKI